MKKLIVLVFLLCGSVLAGDVYVKTFEITNRDEAHGYLRFIAKIEIANTGGESGHWKAEVQGLDKTGFPIAKQTANIETYLPAFGSIKDADEMIFESREVVGVEKWQVVIKPRGY